MKKIILILMILLTCSGCSILKTAIAPLTPVVNTLPQAISKSKVQVVCKGKIEFDINGNIKSCEKGYKNYGYNFNEQERKLRWNERVGQWFSRSAGLLIIGSILLILAGNGLFGAFLGRLVGNMFGEGKAFFATLKGIKNAKKYVRENGTKYTLAEREIYQQGAKDILAQIEKTHLETNTKKIIDKMRAKV